MNRIDFLHNLYLALEGVPDPARREMLTDYEEHFRLAAMDGRSEEETAAALGDPALIARELMDHRETGEEGAAQGSSHEADAPPHGWNPGPNGAPPPGWNPGMNGAPPPGWNSGPNGAPPPGWNPGMNGAPPPGWNSGTNGAPPPGWRPPEAQRGCLSGCLVGSLLLFLNLVFVFGPLLGYFGVLFGAWCTALGLSVGGVAALVASLIAFSAPGWIPASLSFATVLAGSVMMISGGMLLGMGLWYVTAWSFRMVAKYMKWSVSLITTRRP